MSVRTIENPVTRERVTYVETSDETGGVRTVIDLEVGGGGGVREHHHTQHQERIEVLEGSVEVTASGVTRVLRAGESVVLKPGTVHSWRNPDANATLRFRGTMTPGHPGFERFLRVWFGLARDGRLGARGLPRRFGDLSLLADLDPSILSGAVRILAPFMRWSARHSRANGEADALLRRYDAQA